MNNENLQDIMLEPDTLIDYGDGQKAIKDFFVRDLGDAPFKILINQSPVIILKDVDGKPLKALDLIEFEEHMKNEFIKAKEKNNAHIIRDYDILYTQALLSGDSYRCYHGQYDSNDTSVVDSIKKYCNNNAFGKIRDELAKAYNTPREELNLNMSFVDYIETHHHLLSLAKKYENTPDSPIPGYVRFDQIDLNHVWADRLSHNYKTLENIENQIAELEKSGLNEPQIIFLDESRFCQNMPLKYAEYEEEYIKEDVKTNYLVLFKGENSTHRIYGEHLQLSLSSQALQQSLKDQAHQIGNEYCEQCSNTPWIREIFSKAGYHYNWEHNNDYKALLKYIADNCPSISEAKPVISLSFEENGWNCYKQKDILLNELNSNDLLIKSTNDVVRFNVCYITPLGIKDYSGNLTGYINKDDVDLRKTFSEIKSADYYPQEKLLVKYIDEKILPNLPKESIIKRAKRKARLIINFTQNNNHDDERCRER